MPVLLEVCVDSIESAINAAEGGAGRIELCSSLAEGGLTPSAGFLMTVKRMVNIPVFAMLRCRPGSDFCYSENEIKIMISDLRVFKGIGVDGYVFGALKPDKSIDDEACRMVIEEAHPLPVTFHRAFDVCQNPLDSLDTVISLGFERILTSGLQQSAGDDLACEFIEKLIKKASNRIIIMPGAGVSLENVEKILKTGARELHGSLRVMKVNDAHVNLIKMGSVINETLLVTNIELVKKVVELLTQFFKK